MYESDKDIPKLIDAHPSTKEGDISLKKDLSVFMTKFEADSNDFLSKAGIMLETLQLKKRQTKPFLKYLASTKIRNITIKANSGWAIQKCLREVLECLNKYKSPGAMAGCYRIIASLNLSKCKDIKCLDTLLNRIIPQLGSESTLDKHILLILSKWAYGGFENCKEQKIRIVKRLVGLIFQYFSHFQDINFINNLDFLRNYISCINIIQRLGKETSTLDLSQNVPQGLMSEEVKDKIFEMMLLTMVMNMMLRLRGGKVAFDVKQKLFTSVLQDSVIKQLIVNVEGENKGIEKKIALKNENHNSDPSLSSGISTSESKSFNIGEKALLIELSRLKKKSGWLILSLIEFKPRIFTKKSNWKLIFPLSNISKSEKFLLDDKKLFPVQIVTEEYWERIEESKEKYYFEEQLDLFKKAWISKYSQEGGKFETQKIKSLMINFKIDYLGLMKNKNAENCLLNIFMSEKDPAVKDFILHVIGEAVKSQPVDIWLLNERKRGKTALKSFKEEVSDSIRNGAMIILLEICLSLPEKASQYISELKLLFTSQESISSQQVFVEFIIDYLILPYLAKSYPSDQDLHIRPFEDLLAVLLRSDYWKESRRPQELVNILFTSRLPNPSTIKILTELLRHHFISIKDQFPLVSEFISSITDTGSNLQDSKCELFGVIVEEYQSYLWKSKSNTPIVTEPADLPKRVLTTERLIAIQEKSRMLNLHFSDQKNVEFFQNVLVSMFHHFFSYKMFEELKAEERSQKEETFVNYILKIDRRNLSSFFNELCFEDWARHTLKSISHGKHAIELVGFFLSGELFWKEQELTQELWDFLFATIDMPLLAVELMQTFSSILFSYEKSGKFEFSDHVCRRLFDYAKKGLREKNKRVVLNSTRNVLMMVAGLNDTQLSTLFDGRLEEGLVEIKNISREFLLSKVPKIAWNTGTELQTLLHSHSTNNSALRTEIRRIPVSLAGEIASQFITCSNLKLKSILGRLLTFSQILKQLEPFHFLGIIKLAEAFQDGSWEEKNFSAYHEAKHIDSVKLVSLEASISIIIVLFREQDENFPDKHKIIESYLGLISYYFERFQRLLEQQGVEFATINDELAKMIYKDEIEFEAINPELCDLIEALELFKRVIEEEDDISFSLNKHDKLCAICERTRLESGLVRMRNIFSTDFVAFDASSSSK